MGLDVVEAFDLLFANLGVVDFEDVDGIFVVETVFIDADDGLTARVYSGVCAGCGLLDAEFGETGFDSLGHTAEFLDFLDVSPGTLRDFVSEGFDVV